MEVGQMLVSLGVAAPAITISIKPIPLDSNVFLEVAAVRAHSVRETKPQVCLTDMPPAPREMKGQHTQQLSYPELDGKGSRAMSHMPPMPSQVGQ